MHGKGVSKGWTAKQHDFARIPSVEIQRSVFNRSCGLKTSFNAGLLIPIFVDEALPGDTFNLRTSSFVRMATPIFPLMDNIWMDFFFFAVPNRLVWDNWQRFNGEQRNPGDSTDFLVPQVEPAVEVSSLWDYLGIPYTDGEALQNVNALHSRAYSLIWNEWFRDQNLQPSVVVDVDDGPDNAADYVLLRRGKRHDYFTSALPFPQKGNPVTLPLGTSAPLTFSAGGVPTFTISTTGPATALRPAGLAAGSNIQNVIAGTGVVDNLNWASPGLIGVADLSSATAATINQIRQAFQIQRLLERDARGGSRYTEILRSHFGVHSPDERLQRPEYLGGGSTRVNVHPVARTTSITVGAGIPAMAELGGFATATASGVGFNKSFVEHCVILGLVSVRADLMYQQGIERMFSRRTRYDFYWPSLAHTGEQAILNKEIFAQGNGAAADSEVFGYQERFAEYRYKPSRTSGLMRSTVPAPIDQWHLGLEFGALPLLNAAFIADNPPMDRILAVPGAPDFFGDFWFDFRCARPMPTFSVPGLIDHF